MFKQTPEGVLIAVKAVPGSKKFELVGIDPWSGELRIKLESRAEKGRANEELVDRLGEVFHAPVTLVTGSKSHKKVVLVKGAAEAQVRKLLE